MSGRSRRVRENHRPRSRSAKRRGGRVVGLGIVAGAFVALGMAASATAPPAHADELDLILDPILDSLSNIDPTLGIDLSELVTYLDPTFVGENLDVGSALAGAAAASGDAADNASVPLSVVDSTEPVVNVSVGGGTTIPVLVDTGSDGLVIPIQDMGWQDIGFPTGAGIGSYSGGLDYFYITVPTEVNFGDGIETGQTDVDVELFTFPTSLQALFSGDYDTSINQFLAGSADGVLGIGPNAVGPGPGSVISALPGDLSDGALINEQAGALVFGPNLLTPESSVDGSPDATVNVSVTYDGVTTTTDGVSAIIDSGGVYGDIPSSVLGFDPSSGVVPAGTEITVYNTDGTELYSYVTNGVDGPSVTSGGSMDTGDVPFADQPVYIDYGTSGGTTIFDQ